MAVRASEVPQPALSDPFPEAQLAARTRVRVGISPRRSGRPSQRVENNCGTGWTLAKAASLDPRSVMKLKGVARIRGRAFDAGVIGITPDFDVWLRAEVLQSHNGLVVEHGLPVFNRTQVTALAERVDQPGRVLLDIRLKGFAA